MIARLALSIAAVMVAGGASAQTANTSGSTLSSSSSSSGAAATMKDLLAQGFEIKSAVPNGQNFVVFMQKDQSAYACEFVSLTNTKCGAIN